MKEQGIRERHLTAEDLVARVFPAGEESAPVPLHLAVCAECQRKVARLREGWLLDRGAVDGVVDALPPVFWEDQAGGVMRTVRTEPAPASNVRAFPFGLEPAILRRPALAVSSLAAALLLVASVTVYRTASRPAAATVSVAAPVVTPVVAELSDDELLRSIDVLVVPDSPFAALDQEG